jgi:DNA modification methylase
MFFKSLSYSFHVSYQIRNCDCFSNDGLPNIPDHSVDVIVADIPYGVTRNVWDKTFDTKLMFDHCFRILTEKGTICLFSQQPYTTDLITAQRDHFRYDLIWIKEKGTQIYECNRRPLPTHEIICVFSKIYPNNYYPQKIQGKPYKKRLHPSIQTTNYGISKDYLTVSNGERFPFSYFYCPRDNANQGLHRTQKPLELIVNLILSYSKMGQTVVDFCMGSGTSIVAALKTKRQSIGFEIDQNMFELAKKRIERFAYAGVDDVVKPMKVSKDQKTFSNLIKVKP